MPAGTTVPHTAHEIASIWGASGPSAVRDVAALTNIPGNKHLVLSAEPGLGSRRTLAGLEAVLGRAGFEASRLGAGGHLAPLTHPAETAAHLVERLAAAAAD